MDVAEASERCGAVIDAVDEVVTADRSLFETILVGVLSRGHVLLEDVPGTGKTLTARAIAAALGLKFSRVQFTPDLLRTFEFNRGPIFANVVLADEINRAPPKTQAALLEAMEEEQVTVDGTTHELPDPFLVIATQNPVEQEGTFQLPEAQIDRFVVKTSIGYPTETGEIDLLRRRAGRVERSPTIGAVLSHDQVRDLRVIPEDVRVDGDVVEYVVALARATREDRRVRIGVSPRGTQRLFEAARSRAVIAGRDYVTPDDVKRVARPTLAHRLVLTADATVDDVRKTDVVADVLNTIPVPTVER
ncbi:ATPase [Halobacteriales archaeon SW_7_68_16]|nr:MAG: ATPase [Halobacteriales archaeon SW_7_68_16]